MPRARIELGCAGHFIGADRCRFRRHTQVGNYRVSTVGDLCFDNKRETLGADKDSFFETMVFRTHPRPAKDNDGCGCRAVVNYFEIDSKRYKTAGQAQAGHEAFVRKYAAPH